MDKLISAEKLKRHYSWWGAEDASAEFKEQKQIFDDIIDVQPAVNAKPIVYAEWKLVPCGPMGNPVKKVCSHCGYTHTLSEQFDFCPKCGAEMRMAK